MAKNLSEAILHHTDGNRILTNRDEKDKLFIVKVRDYLHPIPCYKHVPKQVTAMGPYIHYYQSRADGRITATYYEQQIEWEKEINVE